MPTFCCRRMSSIASTAEGSVLLLSPIRRRFACTERGNQLSRVQSPKQRLVSYSAPALSCRIFETTWRLSPNLACPKYSVACLWNWCRMQTQYSGPPVQWDHPLFTRRTVQTSCVLAFDFEWVDVIGHNQPRFQGLHDLSQAVNDFAKVCGKSPVLLLSDKTDVPFDEQTTDSSYIAVVNIRNFLACVNDHDRSALFFLSAISKHESISAVSAGSALPMRVQQLLQALELGLQGKAETVIEAVMKGGSKLTLALLDAAIKGLE